jgi:hypothetical protein
MLEMYPFIHDKDKDNGIFSPAPSQLLWPNFLLIRPALSELQTAKAFTLSKGEWL